MSDRTSDIAEALRSASERGFERAIELLSKVPPAATAREALPVLIEELRDADAGLSPALRAHCNKLFERYGSGLSRNEPGYTRTELSEIRRSYRETTTFGRLINKLWPF